MPGQEGPVLQPPAQGPPARSLSESREQQGPGRDTASSVQRKNRVIPEPLGGHEGGRVAGGGPGGGGASSGEVGGASQ